MKTYLYLLMFYMLVSPWGASAKMKVVATLPALGALAQEVGSGHIDVATLASHNQDPHYVDARPNLALKLNQADLVLVNGLELEEAWLAPLMVNARNAKITPGQDGYFDASAQVSQLLMVPQGKVDRAQGDVHPGGNPHFIFDPRALSDIALALGARMAKLDAENAQTYQDSAVKVSQQLTALADSNKARFMALTESQRQVVSYHQSFPYLYDWLGLSDAATIEPKPGIPPTPDRIARVMSVMRSSGAKVIIQEGFQPQNISKTLIGLTNGSLVVVPAGPDVSAKETTAAWIGAYVEALYGALSN